METNVLIKSYLLILVFFAMANLLEVTVSQTTRPLCYTQISAANQACAILSPEAISSSFVAATNGTKQGNAPRDDGGDNDDDGGDDDGGGGDDNDGGDGGDDDGGGGDDDDHGGDDDDHGDDDDGDHGDNDDDNHHRRRRHKHKRGKKGHHESSANKECCRWLQEVDNDCVCEVLLKLPPFLVKPKHKFLVRVGRTCRLTYNCPGFQPIPRSRRR